MNRTHRVAHRMPRCPHCRVRHLLATGDRESAGWCPACGDIYVATLTPEEAQVLLAVRPAAMPKRWVCQRCMESFGRRSLLEKHGRSCSGEVER